jgi:hypothetical protein
MCDTEPCSSTNTLLFPVSNRTVNEKQNTEDAFRNSKLTIKNSYSQNRQNNFDAKADLTASLCGWQMRRGTTEEKKPVCEQMGGYRKWRGKSRWDIFLEMASRVHDAFQCLRPHRVHCKGDKWMKNWEGFGRKRSWPNFKVLYRKSLGANLMIIAIFYKHICKLWDPKNVTGLSIAVLYNYQYNPNYSAMNQSSENCCKVMGQWNCQQQTMF